ncbi:hypothetical protein [Sandarakinorhabdus sp. DWP1-3-1]|uniref:hypothetical protein n=1 Tax=Sandarakinorhabdus sp. DWP1-3-1 TaxID=2804627 RepID=UPI003CF75F3A
MTAWMDNIGTASFRRVRTVVANQSPFNGKVYRSGFDDARWQFRFDYQLMHRAEAAPLLALIAAQEEGTGSFEVYDPDFGIPQSGYTAGGATIRGPGQTGKVLNTHRWAINSSIAKAGDRIFIQSVVGYQMFVLTADVNSDVDGRATINIDTPYRGSPPDEGNLGLVPALVSVFRLTCRLVEYDVQSQPGGLFQISVTGEEIL